MSMEKKDTIERIENAIADKDELQKAGFPPRVRGYLRVDSDDKIPYWFCPEQWAYAPFYWPKSSDDIEFVSLEEHEAILAGVNNQLQTCARQIDQFQSKLCKQDEALKIAREALEALAYCSDEFAYMEGLEGGPHHICDVFKKAKEAKQKIEEILTKENENEEIKSNDFME